MNKKPILVIMAAGMGSRYGGLKQMDPIGPAGELIIDYSLYDAKRAGFEKAICIIKHEIEDDFKAIMSRSAAKYMDIRYAFQDISDIPEGFQVPEGRVKPWGTGHAVLAARDLIDAPFAVINADDYYGPEGMKLVYDYLCSVRETAPYDFCMVGYHVENTISENGGVTRGVCMGEEGFLKTIHETPEIRRWEDGIIRFTENGESGEIAEGTLVSMNLFGFTQDFVRELKTRFPGALETILRENPAKGEYYVPKEVGALVNEGKATVRILDSKDKWYGVTYREDRAGVVAAMKAKTDAGLYPEVLWK